MHAFSKITVLSFDLSINEICIWLSVTIAHKTSLLVECNTWANKYDYRKKSAGNRKDYCA